jgi:hypothetical protein
MQPADRFSLLRHFIGAHQLALTAERDPQVSQVGEQGRCS